MDFHDMSTTTGKLKLALSRLNWRWLLYSGIAVATFITIWVATVANTSDGGPVPVDTTSVENSGAGKALLGASNNNDNSGAKVKPKKAPKLPGSFFLYNKGDGSEVFKESNIFSAAEQLWNPLDKSAILVLEIHNYFIDVDELASFLQNATNVQSVTIVTTTGIRTSAAASKIYLPNLKEFSFSLDLDTTPEPYKDEAFLKALLFFDKSPTQETQESPDLASQLVHLSNVGINVKIAAGHQTVLEIRPSDGLLSLNVPYCSQLLQNLHHNSNASTINTYSRLVLSWCPLTLSSETGNNDSLTLSSSVKYLNLNNALPPTQVELTQLMKQLQKNTKLEEFHGFMAKLSHRKLFYFDPARPMEQIQIDVNDLPRSLKVVSLSKIALTSSGNATSGPGLTTLTNLTLEACNVTDILNLDFETLFPNLKNVYLFQLNATPEGSEFKLLNKIIQHKQVESVLVAGLTRNPDPLPQSSDEDRTQIEGLLTSLGPAEGNFILSGRGLDAGSGSVRSARSLTDYVKHHQRFELMGFSDLDEFDYYEKHDAGESGGSQLTFGFLIPLITCALMFTV